MVAPLSKPNRSRIVPVQDISNENLSSWSKDEILRTRDLFVTDIQELDSQLGDKNRRNSSQRRMTSQEYNEWRRRAVHARLVALNGLRRVKTELRHRIEQQRANLLQHPMVAKAIALVSLHHEAACREELPGEELLDATEDFLLEAQSLTK